MLAGLGVICAVIGLFSKDSEVVHPGKSTCDSCSAAALGECSLKEMMAKGKGCKTDRKSDDENTEQ